MTKGELREWLDKSDVSDETRIIIKTDVTWKAFNLSDHIETYADCIVFRGTGG